jgi:hypothetical protein
MTQYKCNHGILADQTRFILCLREGNHLYVSDPLSAVTSTLDSNEEKRIFHLQALSHFIYHGIVQRYPDGKNFYSMSLSTGQSMKNAPCDASGVMDGKGKLREEPSGGVEGGARESTSQMGKGTTTVNVKTLKKALKEFFFTCDMRTVTLVVFKTIQVTIKVIYHIAWIATGSYHANSC